MGDGVGECLTAKISIVPAVMPKTPFCAGLSMPPVLRTMMEKRVVSEAFRRGGVRVGVCGVGGGCIGEHVGEWTVKGVCEKERRGAMASLSAFRDVPQKAPCPVCQPFL
jgi:hypothetical protein